MNTKQVKTKLQTMQPEPECPLCGSTGLTSSWSSFAFDYGSGESIVELMVNVPVHQCEACKFEYLDEEAERLKHEAVCQHLGVLSPAEIRRIREELHMTRSRFAQVAGFGEASLNRWENGLSIQTYAYDRYLRLLTRPGNMRYLECITSSKIALQTETPARSPFRVLQVTDNLLKAQESFQLHLAA